MSLAQPFRRLIWENSHFACLKRQQETCLFFFKFYKQRFTQPLWGSHTVVVPFFFGGLNAMQCSKHWCGDSFTISNQEPHQMCGCPTGSLCKSAGFVQNILHFPATPESQKMPNHTNMRSHNTAAITQEKIWQIPNHNRDTTNIWCIPQVPICNMSSRKIYTENESVFLYFTPSV